MVVGRQLGWSEIDDQMLALAQAAWRAFGLQSEERTGYTRTPCIMDLSLALSGQHSELLFEFGRCGERGEMGKRKDV